MANKIICWLFSHFIFLVTISLHSFYFHIVFVLFNFLDTRVVSANYCITNQANYHLLGQFIYIFLLVLLFVFKEALVECLLLL